MAMVLIHVFIQWFAFISYAKDNGVDVAACLHLIFLAIYNFSALFALELITNPEGMLAVQNEIFGIQRLFKTCWTHHPIIIFLLPSMQMLLMTVPLISISLFLLDQNLPMFVVSSSLIKITASLRRIRIEVTVVAALVEAFLLSYSALLIFSVSQTCAILAVALNVWMNDSK